MLIIDAEVAGKIDQNRGDMSRTEFLNFLIDSQLKEEEKGNQTDYVTKKEFQPVSYTHLTLPTKA